MTKKEYLIKLLGTIGPDILPVSQDILYLIENNQINDEIIDSLYIIFQKVLKNTNNEIEKNKIQKGISFLDKIKSLEDEQNISDQKDIAQLDEMLKNI